MEYRKLGRTGLLVSEIGMGCEGFVGKPYSEVEKMVDAMEAGGVNCIDLYTPNPEFRSNLGHALRGRREKFILQAHLCTIWKDGQYKRTRDLAEVREGFDDQLHRLETDHVEIGMIHYVDSMADWEAVRDKGVLDYARELKAQGVIRCIGLSSHNPEVALEAVHSGAIEVLMFSVNPCYDLQPAGEDVEQLWNEKNYEQPLVNMDPQRQEFVDSGRRGHHGDESLRRRRSAQRGAVPGRKGSDPLSVSPLCFVAAWCGLRYVRRPDTGGAEYQHRL